MLAPINLPTGYNYIGAFLTLQCNLSCSYCINRFGRFSSYRRHLTGKEWVDGLNRIIAPVDLPVTLQGGEPTLHSDFIDIVNGINPEMKIDLLTNLETDLQKFMFQISPERMRRDAPYASIRVSYHPETMEIKSLADRVCRLLDAGYHVGIWGVLHPKHEYEVRYAQDYCISRGIDFRTKEFLGEFEGTMYGQFSYQDACDREFKTSVNCRTTELIIGPDGGIYRCHSDLYAGRTPIGSILDPELVVSTEFRRCDFFGGCNPCDVKLKTDRFQSFGHTSVEIIDYKGSF